jgi:hypothetical protein
MSIMRRLRLETGLRLTARRFKITDARPARREEERALSEDEQFFAENDEDPTEEFIRRLERDREYLETKEKLGEATPEWQEYEEEVENTIYDVESGM